jgi:hypothetical protein
MPTKLTAAAKKKAAKIKKASASLPGLPSPGPTRKTGMGRSGRRRN